MTTNKPPSAAAVAAAEALQSIPADQNHHEAVVIARAIATQQDLTQEQLARVKSFHNKQAEPGEKGALAKALFGGPAMADWALNRPDPTAAPTAYIVAYLPDHASQILKIGAHTPETIPLIDLGPLKGLTEIDRMQAAQAVEDLAAATPPIAAAAKWATTAQAGGQTETRVAWETPQLHAARQTLVKKLEKLKVPLADETPWTPNTSQGVTASAESPTSYQRSVKFESTITTIGLIWGNQKTRIPLNPEPVVTAAATNKSLVTSALTKLHEDLEKKDRIWIAEISATVQLGFAAALDRIGRTITRGSKDESLKKVTAAAVAVTADGSAIDDLDLDRLIGPPVQDAIDQATRITKAHAKTIASTIAAALAVDISPTIYESSYKKAISLLRQRLTAEILYRVTTPLGVTQIETLDPGLLVVPPAVTRDFAAVAGGASTEKDEHGHVRPVHNKGVPQGDTEEGKISAAAGIGTGILGLLWIRKAIRVFKGEPQKGFTARSGDPIISDALTTAAFRKLRAVPTVGLRYRWTPEFYGTIATEHHPDHVPHFGKIVDDPDEVGATYPGDHANCRCGWAPKITVRLNT